jgi:dethiobiotin synthetase
MIAIVVTGTDTRIGKTVFAAGLTRLLEGIYWKPMQAGLDGETDTAAVRRLAELSADRTSCRWMLCSGAGFRSSASP